MTALSIARGGSLTVLKIGGELIESPEKAATLVGPTAQLLGEGPLLIVHGGGKDIDVEAGLRGLSKKTVEGLRITDAATRDAVVAALAGTVNTRLVAALAAGGVRAVGLTGADAMTVGATLATPHRALDGSLVDLGLVGEPADGAAPALVVDLLSLGYVPVVACLGCSSTGEILNINADTLAASLARRCGAARLMIAGATPGVLDANGLTINAMSLRLLDDMIRDGRASAGMVAKLRACREAFVAGLAVAIIDGRATTAFGSAPGTRLISTPAPSLT